MALAIDAPLLLLDVLKVDEELAVWQASVSIVIVAARSQKKKARPSEKGDNKGPLDTIEARSTTRSGSTRKKTLGN